MHNVDEKIKRKLRIELARRDFYTFCRLMNPEMYKTKYVYLKKLCEELQRFYEDKECKVLFLSMPPQFGKSYTVRLFIAWLLGKNKNLRIISSSYNQDTSFKISRGVRNIIKEQGNDKQKILYHNIFYSSIERGVGAVKAWKLDGSNQESFVASSPKGSSTSYPADIEIFDDILKDHSFSEKMLNEHWEWFIGTMLSRLTGPKKIIMIATRWTENDLIGKYKKQAAIDNIPYKDICFPIEDEEGNLLCEDKIDRLELERRRSVMSTTDLGKAIFMANYYQTPMDVHGRLYTNKFKTYLREDIENGNIKTYYKFSYTDTADEGSDYLAHIEAAADGKNIYITNVIYTKSPMDITEGLVSSSLNKNNIEFAEIESNNGGRNFARAIQRILGELGNYSCEVDWFYQGNNKIGRISTKSPEVMYYVYMPEDWATLWPEFYRDITEFNIESSLHDDGPDALTGIVELAEAKSYIIL